jgi:hypothetical protein
MEKVMGIRLSVDLGSGEEGGRETDIMDILQIHCKQVLVACNSTWANVFRGF